MLIIRMSVPGACSHVGDFVDVRTVGDKAIHILNRSGRYQLAETEICEVCRILTSGSMLVGARKTDGSTVFEVLVDSPTALGHLLRRLTQAGYRPRVLGRAKYLDKPGLTRDQVKALLAAYRLGLFDESRNASIRDLAARLGVSPAAASRMLRRAVKRLVEFYLAQLGLLDSNEKY